MRDDEVWIIRVAAYSGVIAGTLVHMLLGIGWWSVFLLVLSTIGMLYSIWRWFKFTEDFHK